MPPCLQTSEGDAMPDATADDGSGGQRNAAGSDGEEVSAAADQLGDLKVDHNDNKSKSSDVANVVTDEDPDLWKPHPPNEDCPVCLVPLPLEYYSCMIASCCGKEICTACIQEHLRRNRILNRKEEDKEQELNSCKELKKFVPLKDTCPFCRAECAESNEEEVEQINALASKGDVHAMFNLAMKYMYGDGLSRDDRKALELVRRAVNLDYAEAYGMLGRAYSDGDWIVPRDTDRGKEYLELGTKKGSVAARTNLGVLAATTRNYTDAIHHWRLSAAAGSKDAMQNLWKCFSKGLVSKAELEDILRDHQRGLDEMKTEQRERLAAHRKARDGNNMVQIALYDFYYSGYLTAKQLEQALRSPRDIMNILKDRIKEAEKKDAKFYHRVMETFRDGYYK